MSIESAAQFASRALRDRALSQELAAATQGKSESEAVSAVVAIGHRNGADFTADEAVTARATVRAVTKQELIRSGKAPGEELSPEELDLIAGGLVTGTDVAIAGLTSAAGGGPSLGYGMTTAEYQLDNAYRSNQTNVNSDQVNSSLLNTVGSYISSAFEGW